MSAEAKHPIKQGAIIGGWLCFALGAAIMHFSLWTFFIYGPLLLVAFILSIAAMSQRRIVGGILLLLMTLIVPPVQWFCTFANRGDKFMEENLPGYKEEKERQKLIKELAERAPNAEAADRLKSQQNLGSSPAKTEPTTTDALKLLDFRILSGAGGTMVLIKWKNTSERTIGAFRGKWYVLDDFKEVSAQGDIRYSRTEVSYLTVGPVEPDKIICLFIASLPDGREQHTAFLDDDGTADGGRLPLSRPKNGTFKVEITDVVFDAVRQEPKPLPVLPPKQEPQQSATTGDRESPQRLPNKTVSLTPDAPPPLESFTEIDGDTAPIVYQLKAPRPVPIETIALDLLGNSYNTLDEFSKRDYLRNLERAISKRMGDAKPEDIYRITRSVHLGEYDFQKNAFPARDPISDRANGIPKDVVFIDVPKRVIGGTEYIYRIHLLNAGKLTYIPVNQEEAESLAPTLRQTRRAEISYIGTLVKCVETTADDIPTNDESRIPIKAIGLKISEMRLTLENSKQCISYKLPKEDTSVPIGLAEPPTIPPRPRVVTITPKREPQQAVTVPAPVVTATGSDAIPTPPAAPPIYVVVGVTPGDFLNVRSEPAMNSNAVFKLTNGDKVQVTGQSAYNGDTEWLPITANSQKGWVRNKYLRLQSK